MAPPANPKSNSQTFVLPDGRTLGYATYGKPASPTTPNIFYFHGFPGSRLEGAVCKFLQCNFPPTHALADECISIGFEHPRHQGINAHVVSIDRPGMGLSTFQPSRRILDWPSDVLALADHLSLPTFHVFAISGGAPYAMACAKDIPRSRLLNTAVVSGAYPLTLGTQGMLFGIKFILYAASWVPSFAGTLLDWDLGAAARNPDPKVFEEKFMKAMAGRPKKDVRCLDDDVIRSSLLEAMRPAFLHDGKAAGYDLSLMSDWGFGLEDVEGMGMTLWHGGADVNAPVGMANKAADLLKGCDFRLFEEETHMSLPFNHGEEILKKLLDLEG